MFVQIKQSPECELYSIFLALFTAYYCWDLFPIKGFYITAAVFVVIGVLLLFQYPAATSTAWANRHNSVLFDSIFSSWTYLAEWPIIVASIVSCFYLNMRYGIASGLLFGIQALLVNAIKYTVNVARPLQELGNALHHADGIAVLSQHSFPSGHTAAAFLGMGLLSMNVKSKYMHVLFACIAAGVGYSRLYLGQHYLADIVAGACISLILLLLYTRLLPWIYAFSLKKKHRK